MGTLTALPKSRLLVETAMKELVASTVMGPRRNVPLTAKLVDAPGEPSTEPRPDNT